MGFGPLFGLVSSLVYSFFSLWFLFDLKKKLRLEHLVLFKKMKKTNLILVITKKGIFVDHPYIHLLEQIN